MAIPDYFLQELKSRTDIVDVVSSYVNLKRSGKNWSGLCPFHGEKTPSFSVNTQGNYYNCFGCPAGGDVINFIMKIENLDYVEAVKFLADRAGLQMPSDAVDNSMYEQRKRIIEINKESARFFYNTLMSNEGAKGLNYFKNRGLSLKLITKFGLGYAPESRFALVNHLRKLGFKKDELVAANVAFMSKKGNPVDRFSGRVMFPIIDLRGDVVAFGGRALGDEKPKYINSSETAVYHKGSMLFAMNFAKNSTEKLILAEGYMDVISLHGAGFTGAIASLGTALTLEQAKIIAKYQNEITICYDSDQAGQLATQRAIPILRDAGLIVKVLTVPGGKDPDEFIKKNGDKGAEKFKILLDNCGNDLEYRFQKLKLEIDTNTPQGKVEYLTKSSEILAGLDNDIEKDIYSGRLSNEIGVDKSAILTQVAKFSKRKYNKEQKEKTRKLVAQLSGQGDKINPEKANNLKVANAEEALIAYIFANPDGISYCKTKIGPEIFCTSFARRVYTTLLGKDIGNSGISLTDISGDFTSEELQSITKIIVRHSEAVSSKADADIYIEMIKNEGAFSSDENIKNSDSQDLANFFDNLKKTKK